MKKIGLILISASFLVASLIAVQAPLEVNWSYYIPVLALGWVGAVMARHGHRQVTQAVHAVAANMSMINTSLDNVVRKVGELNANKDDINTYDVRHRIDEDVLGDLDDFAQAREAISHKYGLQAYADIMSHFAAGERYLNRVWSASADGYIDEVNMYLGRADEEFNTARSQLQQFEGGAA